MVVVSRLLASGPTNPPRAPSPLPRPLDDVHEAIHAPSLPRLVVHDQVELRLPLRRRRAQQRLGLLVALDAHVLRHVCRRVGGGGEREERVGWGAGGVRARRRWERQRQRMRMRPRPGVTKERDQGARPRSATKELGGPRRGGGGPRRARVVFLPSMAASASHPWRATPLSPRSRFVSRLLT